MLRRLQTLQSIPFANELVHKEPPELFDEGEKRLERALHEEMEAHMRGEDRPVLDESQAEARRQALAQRVSLIQGPPGTGKTFVGVQARAASLCSRPRLLLLALDDRAAV